ncbi:VapA/VapB family virulence-associated protein [Rhodococcus hoagii]|nr:VapA/VapB family virulence-associated protein [Prescottella equi]
MIEYAWYGPSIQSNRCCGDCPILLALGGHRTCRLATPSAWVGTPSAAGKVLPPINNNADEQYAVHGVVFSAVFYNHVRISVDGGMTFDGEGGGLSTPGGGALWGNLMTSDLLCSSYTTKLRRSNVFGPYLKINFYDSYGGILGSVHASGVSAMIGRSGRSGRWHVV